MGTKGSPVAIRRTPRRTTWGKNTLKVDKLVTTDVHRVSTGLIGARGTQTFMGPLVVESTTTRPKTPNPPTSSWTSWVVGFWRGRGGGLRLLSLGRESYTPPLRPKGKAGLGPIRAKESRRTCREESLRENQGRRLISNPFFLGEEYPLEKVLIYPFIDR